MLCWTSGPGLAAFDLILGGRQHDGQAGHQEARAPPVAASRPGIALDSSWSYEGLLEG